MEPLGPRSLGQTSFGLRFLVEPVSSESSHKRKAFNIFVHEGACRPEAPLFGFGASIFWKRSKVKVPSPFCISGMLRRPNQQPNSSRAFLRAAPEYPLKPSTLKLRNAPQISVCVCVVRNGPTAATDSGSTPPRASPLKVLQKDGRCMFLLGHSISSSVPIIVSACLLAFCCYCMAIFVHHFCISGGFQGSGFVWSRVISVFQGPLELPLCVNGACAASTGRE